MKLPRSIFVFAVLPQIIFAAAEPPGEHAAAGKEPATQAEKDWVDSRWQQMDVGSFLSSSLNTPVGWVAKGLSIRVGEKGEASVCYDTGSPSMRAAWTGGFLKFSAGRFGLSGPLGGRRLGVLHTGRRGLDRREGTPRGAVAARQTRGALDAGRRNTRPRDAVV